MPLTAVDVQIKPSVVELVNVTLPLATTAPVNVVVPLTIRLLVIVRWSFVPAMNTPPEAPGTALGRLFTVPVGAATLKNCLNAAAIRPLVSVSAVVKNMHTDDAR